MDIGLISNDSESSEGDSVTTNKLPSWIWGCPVKYDHVHVSVSACTWHTSRLATGLSRVQHSLHGQGEEKARAISYPVIPQAQTATPMLAIRG